MKEYIDALRKQITDSPLSFGDADSVLSLLYEAYSEGNRLDDARIKADFHALYQTMNGLTLQEMNRILDPLCTLCRDHDWAGFVSDVQVGVQLAQESEPQEWFSKMLYSSNRSNVNGRVHNGPGRKYLPIGSIVSHRHLVLRISYRHLL